ncbi:MAG: cation:proton antiporter [Longimicrobiales bacterium]
MDFIHPLILPAQSAEAPITEVLGVLAAIILAAKALGEVAERLGQPAVLGEMLAGVVLGPSVLALVDPSSPILQLMAEVGVVVLLFSIGLETELKRLLEVGGTSVMVALAGVVLPFAGGFAVSLLLGLTHPQAIVMGAALTATSVGITARVLGDLGQLNKPDGQVILGAAIVDDVVGLIILAVVSDAVSGATITIGRILLTTTIAFGFLIVAVVVGGRLADPILRIAQRRTRLDAIAAIALASAFLLALAADRLGSAPIIGAFAAGLILAPTPHVQRVEAHVRALGSFFVPIFFVSVGAAVDLRSLAQPGTLVVGGLLLLVALIGKVAAGFAPWWYHGNRLLIGIGMVPRGEVGLIFAQLGLALAVLDDALFSALALVVFVTTFIAPPLLKRLSPVEDDEVQPEHSPIADLVSDS